MEVPVKAPNAGTLRRAAEEGVSVAAGDVIGVVVGVG